MFNRIASLLISVFLILLGTDVLKTGNGYVIYGYHADFGELSIIAGWVFLMFGVLMLLLETEYLIKKLSQPRGKMEHGDQQS